MQTDTDVRVPGDKSITHRALILAGLATGRSRIRRPLLGADTRSTADAMRALGVDVAALSDDVIVAGAGLHGLHGTERVIDCGNSGTTARLLMGVLAGCPFESALTGDASLRSRPMRRVTAPLELMGATFHELGAPDRLPIRMQGGALRPLRYDSPHASAQVKSAIMLAGLTGSADVVITEPILSRDHTERMLARIGVPLRTGRRADGRIEVMLSPASQLAAFDIDIPGDISSAAFVAAFALLAASEPVRIRDVGLNPTRTGFIDVVHRMGGRLATDNVRESCGEPLGDIIVERSELRATRITADEIPSLVDEVPILAILAGRAAGTTVIEGAGELRLKETDRIRALVDNLKAVGVTAAEHRDGLEVQGSDHVPAGSVRVHGDHRIAMAFGVLSAATGGSVQVDDPAAVDVSFPGFWEMIAELGARTRQ
jgi:3-phosphoshikimate 1-carboxyvinyltransferase